jgi:hypothetical protein
MKLNTEQLKQMIKEELMEMMEDPNLQRLEMARQSEHYQELVQGNYSAKDLAMFMENSSNSRVWVAKRWPFFLWGKLVYPGEDKMQAATMIEAELEKKPEALTDYGLAVALAVVDIVKRDHY